MTNPKPHSGFQAHEVRDYERSRYRHLDQRLIDRREKKIISHMLSASPEKSCLTLDMPCGYGRFAQLLLEKSERLIAADIAFHMVHRAIEKSLPDESPILGAVGDAVAGLPFENGVFDLVVSMRLFHHLRRPEQRTAVLAELARISRSRVLLSYYRLNRLHSLQRTIRKGIRRGGADIRMLAESDFRREAEEAGLEVEKTVSVIPGLHAQSIVLLRKTT